jgi:hypothetical protein
MKMKSKATLHGLRIMLVGGAASDLFVQALGEEWDRGTSVLRVQLCHIISGRFRYACGSLADDDGVVTVDLRVRVGHLEAGGGRLNRICSRGLCLRFHWVSNGCNGCTKSPSGGR